MKKLSLIAAVAALAVSGSAFAQEKTAPALPKCEAPIATIMVGKLQCKAGNCQNASAGQNNPLAALLSAAGQPNMSSIGDGIKDMMTTALQETGCFEVMEREAMDEIAKELALAGKKLETKQADFLVSGSITQIDVEKKSTSFGGGFIPIIGAVGVNKETASVAMDLRLVSVDTAKIVGSKKVAASTENSSFGIGGLGFGTAGGSVIGFGGGYSALKGTNLEAVARDAVLQSTIFLVDEAKKVKGR